MDNLEKMSTFNGKYEQLEEGIDESIHSEKIRDSYQLLFNEMLFEWKGENKDKLKQKFEGLKVLIDD